MRHHAAQSERPRERSTAAVPPVLHEEPAGQTWQSTSASRPLSLPNRPAGHDKAALLPSGQYEPAGQP